MTMKNKKVIVIGAARSGLSTVTVLKKLGAHVTLNDIKKKEQIGDLYESLLVKVDRLLLGSHPTDLEMYDFMVLSPGVPTDLPFIVQAKKLGVEVIGELELAYRNCKGQFIGITGTNGKTTTTSLVGEIFKASSKKYSVVGNIGLPAISKALEADADTYMVTELSSFQLETVSSFKPIVGAILNLTPDHLNRHKTMASYVDAKCQLFKFQDEKDVMLLNYDNLATRELKERIKSKVVYFSRKEVLTSGIYVEDDKIVINDDGLRINVGEIKDIFIPGPHNLENVLAAVGLSYYAGVDIGSIMSAVRSFRGVEHRLEFVDTIKGITFFNDSKGTNPDATIQAVRAMNSPTILIAGGMDKGSDFNKLIESFGSEIKKMILIGETKDLIERTAKEHGFSEVHKVATMADAVALAYDLAEENYNVLLSPACASWDMYESYEVRGEEFKALVRRQK